MKFDKGWGDYDLSEDETEKVVTTKTQLPQTMSQITCASSCINKKPSTLSAQNIAKKPNVLVRVRKTVVERKTWKKFGKCAHVPPGCEDGITFLGEDIKLNLFCQKREFAEDLEKKEIREKLFAIETTWGDLQAGENKTGKYVPVHLRANSKALVACAPDSSSPAVISAEKQIIQAMEEQMKKDSLVATGKYIPIYLRNQRAQARHAIQSASGSETGICEIKVENLPEDTTLADIWLLLDKCGPHQRPVLPRCFKTQKCRGFAFCIFDDSKTAQDAVIKLNGRPYGALIMRAHLNVNKP